MMEEMLRRMVAEHAEQERKKPRPLPEAVVMELRQVAERYGRNCPFKVGDLVTPVTGSNMKGAGEPHIVIDLKPPEYRFNGNPGTSGYGVRVDLRVLQIIDGTKVAHWVESAMFDAWSAPTAKPEPAVAVDPVSSEDEAFHMRFEPVPMHG